MYPSFNPILQSILTQSNRMDCNLDGPIQQSIPAKLCLKCFFKLQCIKNEQVNSLMQVYKPKKSWWDRFFSIRNKNQCYVTFNVVLKLSKIQLKFDGPSFFKGYSGIHNLLESIYRIYR